MSSSEDILDRKTDVCLSNALVKTSIGFGVGVVASAVLFRRRAFPVWLSTGFGLGAAYSDCQRTFDPSNIPGYKIASPEIARKILDAEKQQESSSPKNTKMV